MIPILQQLWRVLRLTIQPSFMFFRLDIPCTLKFKCFQKSKFIARNTRAGNQKRDPPFSLTAPEIISCVKLIKTTDNDV